MDDVARTSRWTAVARARESRRSDRLFTDPYAAALVGDEAVAPRDLFGFPRTFRVTAVRGA